MDAGLSPGRKRQWTNSRKKNRPAQFHGGAAVRRGQPEKVADFSSSTLENIRTKDLGEVGEMVTGLVTELKSFDATGGSAQGHHGLFPQGHQFAGYL